MLNPDADLHWKHADPKHLCASQHKHKIITNHLIRQLLHEVNIEGLETVPVRGDEVEAAVDPVVHNVLPVQAALVTQIPAREENNKI